MELSPWYSLLKLFSGSILATWALTFPVRATAIRLGILAKRNARRQHERDTPLLGGTGIYLVLVAVTLGAYLFRDYLGSARGIDGRSAVCTILSLSLIFGIGVIDDWHELKAPPKFVAQALAAFLMVCSEPELPQLFQFEYLPSWVSVIFLTVWIVGITNAMNMIDGLDGLCSGVGAITGLTVAAIIMNAGALPGFEIYLVTALAGCCVGFLFHNFHPARIFLGDSGSMLIGFALAVVSIKVDAKKSLFLSLSLPIMLLGLPLLDVAFAVIRRRRLKRSLFKGDRGHFHHRLRQMGLSHLSAVVVLWICTAYLNLSAFLLAQVPQAHSMFIYALFIPPILFAFASLYFLEHRLSFQMAKFGHLFLKQEYSTLGNRERLLSYLCFQVQEFHSKEKKFAVAIIDCGHFLKELAHERPYRVVAFYMELYSILKARLRETDLVARVTEHRFAVLLEGVQANQPGQKVIIDYLMRQVRGLQESYQVFQSHEDRPEGFEVLYFPSDAQKIWSKLDVTPDQIQLRLLKRPRAA